MSLVTKGKVSHSHLRVRGPSNGEALLRHLVCVPEWKSGAVGSESNPNATANELTASATLNFESGTHTVTEWTSNEDWSMHLSHYDMVDRSQTKDEGEGEVGTAPVLRDQIDISRTERAPPSAPRCGGNVHRQHHCTMLLNPPQNKKILWGTSLKHGAHEPFCFLQLPRAVLSSEDAIVGFGLVSEDYQICKFFPGQNDMQDCFPKGTGSSIGGYVYCVRVSESDPRGRLSVSASVCRSGGRRWDADRQHMSHSIKDTESDRMTVGFGFANNRFFMLLPDAWVLDAAGQLEIVRRPEFRSKFFDTSSGVGTQSVGCRHACSSCWR